MDDYFPLRDPNWGEINIWGRNETIDSLPWYEKYAYMKSRFASDGLLFMICKGHWLIGEDAIALQDKLKMTQFEARIIRFDSPYGLVLAFDNHLFMARNLKDMGFTLYQYFAGQWNHETEVEYMDVCDFLDEIQGRKSRPIQFPEIQIETGEIVQLRLFE